MELLSPMCGTAYTTIQNTRINRALDGTKLPDLHDLITEIINHAETVKQALRESVRLAIR
jgi:hypothetical protein